MKNNKKFNFLLNLEETNRLKSLSFPKENNFREKLENLNLPLIEKEKIKADFEEMLIAVKEEYFTVGTLYLKED